MRRILGLAMLFVLGCEPSPPDIALPSVDLTTMESQVAAKIEKARQAVQERPESAIALGRLGMIFQAHALDAAAIECYLQASERAAADYRWPYLAAMAQRNLDLEGALDFFDRAIELRPRNPAVYVHHADLLLQLGSLDQAEQQYRAGLEQDPDVSHALYGLAQIEMARQQLEAAASHLEEAVRISPSHGEAQALLARAYQQLGEEDKARQQELLARVYPDATVAEDPTLEAMRSEAVSSRSYTERGLRLVDAGRFADAEAAFRKVLNIRPGTARDLANVGAALAKQGRHDEAIAFYQQALGVEPADPYTLNSLAMSWAEQGRIAEAVAQLKEVVERDAAYAEARYNLGLLQSRLGDHEAAVEQYRLALDIEPALSDARNNLGTSLATLGEMEAALEAWREALWLKPNDLTLLYNLSAALAKRGEYREAVELLRRALSKAPNSSRIASLLSWQLATAPSDELRDGAEAVQLARRVHETYPNQPSTSDVLAAALAEQGEFEEAIEIAEQGLELARRSGDAALTQGLIERLWGYRLNKPYRQDS